MPAARRVRRAVRDGTDTAGVPVATSSRHHRHLRHGSNSIYIHNSSSSPSLLADDEDSLAGSPDEADAPNVVDRPIHAKRCSPRSTDSSQHHDSECDRTPRIATRFRSDSSVSSINVRTPRNRNYDAETTPLFIPDRGKGKGRAIDSSPRMDTPAPFEQSGHEPQEWPERVDIGVPRNLVEVEQFPACTEPGPDPRDFYASDSPVPDDYPDSGRDSYKSAEEFHECDESEVQVENSVLPRQHLPAPPQSFASPSRISAALLSRNRLGVSLHQDTASGGHSTGMVSSTDPRPFTGSQNAELSQLESRTNAADFPRQSRSGGNACQRTWKRRGRSPQRRGPEKLQLAGLVRIEIDSLLRENPPYGRTPEPSRVSTFVTEWKRTGQGIKACDATPADFMIDVAGLPRSPWNISAARVFTDHFIRKMEYDDTREIRKKIEGAFTNRIRSLKSRHKKEGLSQAEKAVQKSKHARQQRKYQLFHRRRNVAKLIKPLTRHLSILEALGGDGMSSDESFLDPDTHQTTYTVTKPEWRHPDLHNWLKIFDQLHHRSHIESWSLDKRGAFPHIRTESQKVHLKSHAPTGLPINAYDPKWIESRQPFYLAHVLCPQMEQQYDFVHSSDVFALLSL